MVAISAKNDGTTIKPTGASMIDTIYIEQEVADHPRTLNVRQRFPHARIVPCEHYGSVFNRKSQNFRLQKQHPALILARKFEKHV